MKKMILIPVLLFIMQLSVFSLPVFAEEKTLEIALSDTLVEVLNRQVGQTVELMLVSGDTISGKVEKVNPKLVHIAKIRGKEFYDAVVQIDSISAITLRMRDR